MKKLIWYLGALLLFYGCPVDKVYNAKLCNNTVDSIEIITSPDEILEYHLNQTQNIDMPMKFLYFDTIKSEWHYALLNNSCMIIFGGTGGIGKRNIPFEYLEIRTKNDTIIHSSREEIWEQFNSEDDYNYVYNID